MSTKKNLNPIDLMKEFLQLESASGTLLILATVFALITANIPPALSAYAGRRQTAAALDQRRPDGFLFHAGRA
jgi:Na+/H+ antiporter NhaA